MISLIIITGTMGAGKTSVLYEASDILARRKIEHAAIDLDALGVAYLPTTVLPDGAMYGNLRSVSSNYLDLGVKRFLIARAIESPAELALCRDATSATSVTVCRLTASIETMERRVRTRESGMLRETYIARVAELNRILDEVCLENFLVINDDRVLTEVASEVLAEAGWISA
jgi:adenylylsulfate kinase